MIGDRLRGELSRAFELQRAGRTAEAEASYAAYLAAFPNDASALNNAAVGALQNGDFALAISRLERLVALAPEQAHVRNNLGFALIQAGRPTEAIAHLECALALDGKYATACNNLGIAYERADRRSEAIAAFERALVIDPRYADAAANLAEVMNNNDDTHGARAWAKRALELNPNHPGAKVALAVADALDGDLGGARAALENLVAEQPQHAGFWRALGTLRTWGGALEAAEVAYTRALQFNRKEMQARFGIAVSLLARGDYAQGWRAFEFRPDGVFGTASRFTDMARWAGEELDGVLLVVCEQGLGDVVQFVRFVPQARKRVKEIVLLADRSWRTLISLLETVSGIDRLVTDPGDIARLPERPLAVTSVLSLPYCLGIGVEGLPGAIPYLSVPAERNELWKPRLAAINRPRVGLAWGAYLRRDMAYVTRQKAIPASELQTLLEISNASFVSLQLGGASSLSSLGDLGKRVVDFTNEIRDFGDTAAIMAQLDLIISTDTSVAHVAGALGKTVWLLDRFNCCWRWALSQDRSPWYPTLRIFRQDRFGDWSRPVAQAAAALKELCV